MAVALYARVSTVKQAEKGLSIPDQLRQMRDWSKASGYIVGQEYIEPGESATDDKRPVFQQMIAEAAQKPAPFEAIIVHSLSRFFRDSLEFALYERKLKRAGVKIISITQQTSDDPSGEMARKIFSIFDEYSSKENGKHTLRAMKENARQGFSNGARPPFGYRTVEAEALGNKGQRKKRLALDPVESLQVKKVFNLYLQGNGGDTMGAKQIATYLNDRGQTLRGTSWTRGRVHEVLSNRAYMGELYFNKQDNKTRTPKPQSEWVLHNVDPIIDKEQFEAVQQRKASRAFAMVSPRIIGSKTLLTGLVKCGCCGAGMTLVTGKGGRYRYYKCQTRIGKGNHLCGNPAVPMEKLDGAVLNALADKVFERNRVKSILAELKKQIKAAQENEGQELKGLQRELDELQTATNRLFEAVEKGLLPLDITLQQRSHKLQARRQEILVEIAGFRRRQALPDIKPRQVDLFCKALRMKLLDRSSGFSKEYLRRLVSEIRLTGNQAEITGSKAALACAVTAMESGSPLTVPTSVMGWLLDLGSNQGPAN